MILIGLVLSTMNLNFLWAGLLGGGIVMITQAIIEGIRIFGGFGNRTLVGLIVNLLVSGISGIIALSVVDAVGLLDNDKNIKI